MASIQTFPLLSINSWRTTWPPIKGHVIWGSEYGFWLQVLCSESWLGYTSHVTWENDFTFLYLSISVDKTEMKMTGLLPGLNVLAHKGSNHSKFDQ